MPGYSTLSRKTSTKSASSNLFKKPSSSKLHVKNLSSNSLTAILNTHMLPPPVQVRAPPVDIYDTPDSFRINVSLPGVPPDHINIDYQHPSHELVIKGNVPWDVPLVQGGVEELCRSEFLKVNECWPTGGLFSRRIKFPAGSKVDASKVTADLKFGVVYIRVPKVLN